MKIVLVAFRIDEEKSVAYRKYSTVANLQRGIKQVMEEVRPHFMSIRIVEE